MDLISFYLKESPNSDGRLLEEIWDWPDEDWKQEHDFIQWLFPLDQPSAFNRDAPLLTEETIEQWRTDSLLQHNLRTSYERWLRFCGIERTGGRLHQTVSRPNVWAGFNHNWLRVTRVLRCLTLLGLKKEANEFFALLTEWQYSNKVAIDDETFGYWRRAVEE